jgi:hypothetical protein
MIDTLEILKIVVVVGLVYFVTYLVNSRHKKKRK